MKRSSRPCWTRPAPAAYDNDWTIRGCPDYPRTTALVATLALVPLSACAVSAARTLRARSDRANRYAAAATLILSGGWLGYLTLPHLFA